ncbi:2'-deoxycytidine 5'-triphosphate deaminase [Pelagibacterium halotolerans]|uniref:Deoxycytidine triphosphate deaminase n=1 Tax=Pelagibacterium halotolerans (strain DSM 22347 / JCM 15775 / CGMCC 1.7692 / B2) TaxID=1082931 RepID=G4R8T6_PELHB|nr:2'-deoxycytidine 5'-triphosphate deaminase [Pelagibacterium halotolerans]AEQ50372.1 deoxycytidine triphosphate deaminase [Pelagibacterium halotolerans B2]QJR19650.1 2'-deoxycytidine 5'-triphosphate deaminase [Pelagibacterium halotolerans]SDZ85663.1 dCTP deaminase [Pelagibacterium halotolerans]
MSNTWPTGVFSARLIQNLSDEGAISAGRPYDPDQIQPASLDLRLGETAFRVRSSFLPGPGKTVTERIETLKLHEIDLTKGAVLERGCVYIVPLLESLDLPETVSASANPKSSTGRLDIFTRVISDAARSFDIVPAGYKGALYLEISPRTFPVLVRTGSRLSQMRFRVGDARLDAAGHKALHAEQTLVFDPNMDVGEGVSLSIDLVGEGRNGLIGFRSKRHTAVVDVDKKNALDVLDYWDPLVNRGSGELILDPDEFYILVSRESVHVPPDYAAEMVPFDPLVGEFRVHYAGFFDPGFGHSAAGGTGSRAVLEVRSREVPFLLGHGQTIGRLIYEKMAERPEMLYGSALGSNYQAQSLKLSKHFKSYP